MTPLVVAHRGASWDEPENTIAAFEVAMAAGADYVEFDVRGTPAGKVVCAHDRVREEPPAHVPSLDDALTTMAGRVGLAVEIKEPAVTAATLAALEAHEVSADGIIVLSGHARALEDTQRHRPAIRTVLHVSRLRPDPRSATRFWGVGLDNRTARPSVIELAHSLGLAAIVYTVNEPQRMLELAGLGVTAIVTDRPDLLRRTLDSRS